MSDSAAESGTGGRGEALPETEAEAEAVTETETERKHATATGTGTGTGTEPPRAPKRRPRRHLVVVALIVVVALVYALVAVLYSQSGRVTSDDGSGVPRAGEVTVVLTPQTVDAAGESLSMLLTLETSPELDAPDSFGLADGITVLLSTESGSQTIDFPKGSVPAVHSISVPAAGAIENWPFDTYCTETVVVVYRTEVGLAGAIPTNVLARGYLPGWSLTAGGEDAVAADARDAITPTEPCAALRAGESAATSTAAATATATATPSATATAVAGATTGSATLGSATSSAAASGTGSAAATDAVTGTTPLIPKVSILSERSWSTLAFGVLLLGLMVVIAGLVLFVSISVYRGRRKVEASFMSWMGAMLFATIPLRGFLPGSPPIGSWIDYLVVLWVIVALVTGLGIYVAAWMRWGSPADSPARGR